MKESTIPDAIPLAAPLACWHESLLSARSDRVVALGPDEAFIATERPLPVGTRVFLELSLGHASNAARGEIDAVVVAGDAKGVTGFRVRFVALDDALRLWIARTLAPEETPARATPVPPLVEVSPPPPPAPELIPVVVESAPPPPPARRPPPVDVPATPAVERVGDATLTLVDDGRARRADEPTFLAQERTPSPPTVDARAARLAPHADAHRVDDPARLAHVVVDEQARSVASLGPRPDDLSARQADDPALLVRDAPPAQPIVLEEPEERAADVPLPPAILVEERALDRLATDDVPAPPGVDVAEPIAAAPPVDEVPVAPPVFVREEPPAPVEDEPVELTLDEPIVDIPPERAEIAPPRDDGVGFNPFADIFTPAPIPPGDVPIELAPAPVVVDEQVKDVVHALGLGANSNVDVRFPDASSLARAAPPVVETPPTPAPFLPEPAPEEIARDLVEPPTVVVSAPASLADDDDEPLSISPAAPLIADSYSGVHIADAPPSGEIVPDPSPFEHAPPRFEFSPPEPAHALVEASPPPTVPPKVDDDDDDLDIAFSEEPPAPGDEEGAVLQLETLATSLGELDPFDAFDAFNASRVQHTPAGGFPVIPPPAPRTPSSTSHVPPIVEAGEDVFSAQRAESAPPPSPPNESGPFVTTLRFDGRNVQKELSEDTVAQSVAAFPTVQTDPQFGVFVPPRTDPMFPAVQIADDALQVTGVPTPPLDDAHTLPHLPSFAPKGTPPLLTEDERRALAQAGSFDDVVEVSSTSQLVKVSRGEDGVPIAVASEEPPSTQDGVDIDFDDLSFATGPASEEGGEELPLVVGDVPPARAANPFLADPNMLTRKR